MAEATTACLDYVQRATGMMLDFTPETLGVLDHYATTVRKELAQRPELGPLVARALGAYFGEVLRARFPSFWRVPSQNVHDWQLCSSVALLWFNPVGVGFDALYGTDEHEGPRSNLRVAPEDRQALAERLEAMPPVSEDEYYLFTTRFEVIEASLEMLRARLEQTGYGGTEFTEEDYAVELGPQDPTLLN